MDQSTPTSGAYFYFYSILNTPDDKKLRDILVSREHLNLYIKGYNETDYDIILKNGNGEIISSGKIIYDKNYFKKMMESFQGFKNDFYSSIGKEIKFPVDNCIVGTYYRGSWRDPQDEKDLIGVKLKDGLRKNLSTPVSHSSFLLLAKGFGGSRPSPPKEGFKGWQIDISNPYFNEKTSQGSGVYSGELLKGKGNYASHSWEKVGGVSLSNSFISRLNQDIDNISYEMIEHEGGGGFNPLLDGVVFETHLPLQTNHGVGGIVFFPSISNTPINIYRELNGQTVKNTSLNTILQQEEIVLPNLTQDQIYSIIASSARPGEIFTQTLGEKIGNVPVESETEGNPRTTISGDYVDNVKSLYKNIEVKAYVRVE